MDTISNKEFYSASEVAKILGISRVAIHKKIKTGELEAKKVGSIFIIPRESLVFHVKDLSSALKKNEIDEAVKRAVKEYGETFKLLGKE